MGLASAAAWESWDGLWASAHQAGPADCVHPSDEKLLQAWRAGDGKAFEILYGRYRLRLYRFLQRMMHGPEVDEVFQDVWLAVIKGQSRYEPSARFVTYLFTIAHHRAIDKFRAKGRSFFVATSDEAFDVADDEPGPLNLTLNAELGEALNQAIAQLALPQREAFLMQAEGELSLEEIATASGVSRETVKSRLRYAHRRLRQSLEEWK